MCGGGIYAYGDIAVKLQSECSLSPIQVANIYTSGQIGNSGLGILIGIMYKFNAEKRFGINFRLSVLYGAVTMIIGSAYFAMDLYTNTCYPLGL